MSEKKLGTLKGTFMLSGVNDKLKPFVQIRAWGEFDGQEIALLGQASPAEIRSQALVWFATAEAAESDSMVVRFLTKDVGLAVEEAMHMVSALREHRTEAVADLSNITEVEE